MTIRDYLKQRFLVAVVTLVVPLIAFKLLLVLMPHVSTPMDQWNPLLSVLVVAMPLGALVGVVSFLHQIYALSCPRCRERLGLVAAAAMVGRTAERCPDCGVGVDDPMERTMESE